MCCGNEELSGIIVSMFRRAGTCVGTVAVAGKKITDVMAGGVTAIGRLLTWPVETPELIAEEQTESTSEGFPIGARDEQETEQKKSAKSLIRALESDLAAAQHRLKKSCKEKNTKPQPSSTLSPVQTEHALPKPVEDVVVGAASLPAVTEEQVRAAVFDNETQRIIFTRALSDIANQDPAARSDAARTIADIRHELSVRVLVNQMASEPSAQVRQECIKTLTTLQMTEGLGVVKQALSDRAALVRLAAVWGLYRLAGAESGPALVRMFSDENVEVRRRAATCIGWLGQEKLAVELLPLLDDSSVSVRLAVVEATGNLRCRQGVTALIEHLNDPEKAVRKAVLGALKTITGKKMSGPFPRDKKSLQRLIARWRGWWKEEQPG